MRKITQNHKARNAILVGTLRLSFLLAMAPAMAAVAGGRRDIVDTAVAAGNFKTLAAAVEAAGLVDALKGEGPLTVLAPTDEAFAKLPDGTLEMLLKPENKDKLVSILTYHVIPGNLTSDVVKKATEAKTLNGRRVDITFLNSSNEKRFPSKLLVNESQVIAADIKASNGIIHVIDTVLLPASLNRAEATALLQEAISKGVPAFNHGNPARTVRLYRDASTKIVEEGDEGIPGEVSAILKTAVARADSLHSNRDKAWAIRHGMDLALFAMQE